MKLFILIMSISILSSCDSKQKIDLLVYNAIVYTVDSNFSKAEAIAVDKGEIVAVGNTKDLQNEFEANEKLDVEGKFIFPGLIDAHSHFMDYGLGLNQADLVGTTSWNDVIDKVKNFAAQQKDRWIVGNGWDQNDWTMKTFPNNEKLNKLFPDRPVILSRIDGHAA
ncbi:MAG: amidohydrolase family protein, partial [Ginsengibacter sp.]